MIQKFAFENVVRLQWAEKIDLLPLKGWRWPIPVMHPPTFHDMEEICIKKGYTWNDRLLFTYWCLRLMHSGTSFLVELCKKLKYVVWFKSMFCSIVCHFSFEYAAENDLVCMSVLSLCHITRVQVSCDPATKSKRGLSLETSDLNFVMTDNSVVTIFRTSVLR